MKITFETESGSKYVICKETMTWERVTAGNQNVRGNTGKMHDWPDVVVGETVVIWGPPLTEGMDVRKLETSRVTSRKEEP